MILGDLIEFIKIEKVFNSSFKSVACATLIDLIA